ncbi:phosphate ABC transporter substrate-binding protein PstS [Psychrobacter sp. I-STPA10]|uniref:phosphate ABC transporter substrate-binding protein PstS n=1 Tax=Psychrobacter sp. I-STPA10 TaxID=2585769 RepID=UPI003FA695F3
MKRMLVTLAVGVLCSASATAATVTGAGASFPQPIYSQWASDYNKATGNQINYQSIGSSGGIKQILAKTVDFGASDAPMSAAELNKNGLIQFPTVVGGVVPIVNVNGVAAGKMRLTGDVLAKIYLGEITKWNDPAIQSINPSLKLPDSTITTAFRSDGSGTTYVFTNYLSQVSSTWKNKVGVDKTVKWPTSATGVGGKGNEGVSSLVSRVNNSIGYVEYAYAKQNKLAYTQLKNRAGNYVQPSDDTFAAAAKVNWSKVPGFSLMITNQPGAQAWPISAATFILMPKNPTNAEASQEAIKFFEWSFKNGNAAATRLDFVPLPESTKNAVRQEWKKIK